MDFIVRALIVEPHRWDARVRYHFAGDEMGFRGGKGTCMRCRNYFEAEGQQTLPPQLRLQEFRTCHPKNTLFCMLIILSYRHLKNSKCRKRPCLVSPYLPGGRSSERNPVAINPLLGSFTRQGVLALIQERRPEIHTTLRRPLWRTIKALSCSSESLVLLPPIQLLSPTRSTFLLPFP